MYINARTEIQIKHENQTEIHKYIYLVVYLFYLFYTFYIYICLQPIFSLLSIMESPYQIILEDLLRNSPVRIIAYPPPYSSGASIEEKFRLVNEAIERAKDLDDRILQLVNMFYLGQLLVRKIESRDQRICKRITR